jgi:hypothetical protein
MPIYFAHVAPPTGPIKIGHSVDPYRRMDSLSSQHKSDVLLFCIIGGNPEKELQIQERFSAFRVRPGGEYFLPALLSHLRYPHLKKPYLRKYKTKAEAKRVPVLMTEANIELAGDYLNGRNGKPRLSGPQTAKKMDVSTASIYGHWKQAGKGKFVRKRKKA